MDTRRHATEAKRADAAGRLREHQAILLDFARVAAEATDLRRLLDIACHHAARATGVAHSKILQYRSDKGDLLVIAGTGWKPGVVGHARLGADMLSPAGRCYQTRQTTRLANVADDPEFRWSNLLKQHGLVALLNAPIAVDGAVWGVLEADAATRDAFDEDDERFLEAVALILALAMQRRQSQDLLERKAEEMARRLAQADTLMREQNHRVRNYFQMILAILASRSRRAASQQSRTELTEVMERVTAIGLAHDLLTVQSGQSVVDAATYLDALCRGVERSSDEELRIERDLEPIQLPPDRAVPVGLILNELLTNSYKYATRPDRGPFVRVVLRADIGISEARLAVKDNGPGLVDKQGSGMGVQLVRALAGQISGRVTVESTETGTEVTLRFPLIR